MMDDLENLKLQVKIEYVEKIRRYFRDGGVDLTLVELKKLFTTKEVLSDKWLQKAFLEEAVTHDKRYLYRIEVLAIIDEVLKAEEAVNTPVKSPKFRASASLRSEKMMQSPDLE